MTVSGLLVSTGALAYRCRNSGKCCESYRIGVDPAKQKEITARVASLPEYAGRDLFTEGVPGSFLNHAMLARPGGKCLFFRSDRLCDLHACFGEEAKPLVCRQYPFIATGTPRGISVGLFYSCPSAVETLRAREPFAILRDPPGFQAPAVTKRVPENYPLWLEPGRPLGWDRFGEVESWILALLSRSDRPLPDLLYGIRAALAGAADGEPLPDAADLPERPASGPADRRLQARFVARLAERRGRIGISAGETDRRLYISLMRLLSARGTWGPVWSEADAAGVELLRRYVCGKVFANILFVEHGVTPAFQSVVALYCLAGWTVRALAALRGGPPDAARVGEAVEYTERLFPHDDGTFDHWSRREAAYETTEPEYTRILLA